MSLSTAFTRPQTAGYTGRRGGRGGAAKSGSGVGDSLRIASARNRNNALGSSKEGVVNLNLSSQKNSLAGGITASEVASGSMSSSMQNLKQKTIQNQLVKNVLSSYSKRPMTAG